MNSTPSRRMLSFWGALLFVGAAFAGCMGTDEASATSGLYVKDALTDDVAEVHVTFVAAEALAEGAQEWIPVYAGERSIELLSLSDTLAREKLADFELPPGEYAGLRIALSHVEIVDNNGTRAALAVLGNVVTFGKAFTVDADGGTDLVVDFDLEDGVDLARGTYTPYVRDVQSSREDADGDGIPDIDDRDDDNDGIEDADDDDRDGDGKEDAPAQEHGMDQRGVFGLCTAWKASETARAHGDAGNSTAFQWLHEQAATENQTAEDYCADQQPPVPGQARGILEMVGEPVSIRGKPEDIPRGRPEGTPRGADAGEQSEGARGERPANGTEGMPGEVDGADDASEGGAGDGHDAPASNDTAASNETYETPADGGNETSPADSTPQETGSGDSASSPTDDG